MPDNEWAERAAEVIVDDLYCDGRCGGIEEDEDCTLCKKKRVFKEITKSAAPQFAVLEKALEMMASESTSCAMDECCPFDEAGNFRECPDDGDLRRCLVEYFKAKARKEVGYE